MENISLIEKYIWKKTEIKVRLKIDLKFDFNTERTCNLTRLE